MRRRLHRRVHAEAAETHTFINIVWKYFCRHRASALGSQHLCYCRKERFNAKSFLSPCFFFCCHFSGFWYSNLLLDGFILNVVTPTLHHTVYRRRALLCGCLFTPGALFLISPSCFILLCRIGQYLAAARQEMTLTQAGLQRLTRCNGLYIC